MNAPSTSASMSEADGAVRRPALAVGVAGWSYPDWHDTVYRLPPAATQPDLFTTAGTGRGAGAAAAGAAGTGAGSVGSGHSRIAGQSHAPDELRFLIRYIDMIEINSTFYRIPPPAVAASWARKVAEKPGFFFTAKISREFTHEFQRDPALAARFRDGLGPLRAAGLLPAVLAQFRYDFADRPESRDMLRWIHEQFAEFAHLVVEVRHLSWESPAAIAFFRDLGVTVANLDYPTGRTSFNRFCCVTHPFGYLRLHGRNREAWFRKASAPHEPYDYDYPDEEIAEIAERARMIGKRVRSLTIVANNHYRGKAVSAALRLKAMLHRCKVPVPPALLETYPGLAKFAQDGTGPGSAAAEAGRRP